MLFDLQTIALHFRFPLSQCIRLALTESTRLGVPAEESQGSEAVRTHTFKQKILAMRMLRETAR